MPTMKIRDRRSGWLWIANSVYDNFANKMQSSTFMVYTALCRYADNDDQTSHPSYEKIADMLNLSRATVATALSELRELKLISWDKVGRHNEYSLLEDPTRLNFRPVENSEPTRLKNVTNPSNGLDTIKTYIKTKELENTLLDSQSSSSSESFELSSDDQPKKSKAADARHQPFREMLEKFYRYCNKRDMRWTAGDAKRLFEYLKQNPEQTSQQLRTILNNYLQSGNFNCALYPRQFLGSLNKYFDGPLDKFGKPISDDERTVH